MEAFQIPVRRSHHHVLIRYHKTIPLRQIRLTVTNKNHLILEIPSNNYQKIHIFDPYDNFKHDKKRRYQIAFLQNLEFLCNLLLKGLLCIYVELCT